MFNRKWKALPALIAAVCVVLSGCAPSLSGGQPEAEILSNGGIAAVQGDYVYYINGSMPAMLSDALSGGRQAAIFRLDKEGKAEQVTNKSAYDFRIYGELLYFIAPLSEDQLALYMTKITGGSPQKIISIGNGDTYFLGENAIAVEKNSSLSVIQIKSNQITELALAEEYRGDIKQIYMTDAHIYYYISNKAGIRQIDLAQLDKEPVVMTNRNGHIYCVLDNRLYYERADDNLTRFSISPENFANGTFPAGETLSNSVYEQLVLAPDASAMAGVSSDEGSQGLYVMKLDGSSRVKITEEMPSALLAGENCLYFCMPSDSSVYKVDYSGENLTLLCSQPAAAGPGETGPDYYMDEADGWLYFFNKQNGGDIWRVSVQGSEAQNLSAE